MLTLNLRSLVVVLLLPLLNSCVVAEERRIISPKNNDVQSAEFFLQEIGKGAIVLRLIESIFSITEVTEQVPKNLSLALEDASQAIRNLARPEITTDDTKSLLMAPVMREQNVTSGSLYHTAENLLLKAWFAGDGKKSSFEKMTFTVATFGSSKEHGEFEIFKRNDTTARDVNFSAILDLFGGPDLADESQMKFLSGLTSYRTDRPGLIEIDAKDLAFQSKGIKMLLTFSVTVNDRNGAIISGTIKRQFFDEQSNELTAEYEWDVETILKKTKNLPSEIDQLRSTI